MVVQISQQLSLAGLSKAFQHRSIHWVKKPFTLREFGLLGLSQTPAAVSPSFASGSAGVGRSLLLSEVKQTTGNGVWGGAEQYGIYENSDEAFRKPAQHYPEPQCINPQQGKPWSVDGCSLSHRSPHLLLFTRAHAVRRSGEKRMDSSGFHLAAFSQTVNQLVKGQNSPKDLSDTGTCYKQLDKPLSLSDSSEGHCLHLV